MIKIYGEVASKAKKVLNPPSGKNLIANITSEETQTHIEEITNEKDKISSKEEGSLKTVKKSLYQMPPPFYKVEEIIKKGIDQEASWTKKSGKYHYGYKKHYLCDKKTSLVLSVVTSTGKDHDSKHMKGCLDKVKLPKNSELLADKAYCGSQNEEILKKKGLKSRIQTKAVRGKVLTYWGKKRNKLISKSRYKVERIFGGIKKWFRSGACRYVGKTKTHGQHVLEAIAYNIKISPGLVISQAKN